MSKICFTLIFTLCVIIIQGADQSSDTDAQEERIDLSDDKNAAFAVIKEYSKETDSMETVETGFPSLIEKIEGKWRLSSAFTKNSEEIHLCPDRNVEIKDTTLQAAYELTPATKSCLFTKKFKSNEPKICAKEPIPWLMVLKNTPPPPSMYVPLRINCNEKNQKLLSFQFNNCDEEDRFIKYAERATNPDLTETAKMQLQFVETDSYPMYEICYDTRACKRLWTRHQVLTPMLFFKPAIKSRNIERIDYNTVGTSTYDLEFMKPDTFTKLTDIYTQNKFQNIDGEYLVPMQHMALQNWKKATYHLINVAPLRERFRTLMQIIDEGLIMVSRYIFTKYGHILDIFTTAETNIDKKNNFLGNSWYKFIYYKNKEAGALIYLHNTEDKGYKRPKCYDKLTCYFNQWIKYKEDPRIENDVLSHAGCCEVYPERIKELFQMDVKLKKVIDIQAIVEITKISDTELKFIGKQDTSSDQSSELGDSQLDEDGNPNGSENDPVDEFLIPNKEKNSPGLNEEKN